MAYNKGLIGSINPEGLDDIAEALMKEKEKKPEKKEEKNSSPAIDAPIHAQQNLDRYIILEGRDYGNYAYPDLLVSMDKNYTNITWYEIPHALARDNSHMLTIRQFVDFLALLKSEKAFDGNGHLLNKATLESLYDSIAVRGNTNRLEWLDAKFSRQGLMKRLYMTYHNVRSSGKSDEVTEPVESCLFWSRNPGMSIDFWLNSSTLQGMPTNKVPDGDLCYLRPKSGKVASFSAWHNKVIFNCGTDPHIAEYHTAVRAVKLK